MGKGDKKSRRGKIVLGTYGVRRPRKKNKANTVVNKVQEVETSNTVTANKVETEATSKAKKTTTQKAPKTKKEA